MRNWRSVPAIWSAREDLVFGPAVSLSIASDCDLLHYGGRLAASNRPSRFYWSGREDLNLRLPRPERGALPGCATPRSIDLFLRPPADTACHVLLPHLDTQSVH
jgi:hypothetical protein